MKVQFLLWNDDVQLTFTEAFPENVTKNKWQVYQSVKHQILSSFLLQKHWGETKSMPLTMKSWEKLSRRGCKINHHYHNNIDVDKTKIDDFVQKESQRHKNHPNWGTFCFGTRIWPSKYEIPQGQNLLRMGQNYFFPHANKFRVGVKQSFPTYNLGYTLIT